LPTLGRPVPVVEAVFTDAEVAALGRSMSARTEALKKF
jgi:hypothetical protein